jgi:hypothetical protein
VLPASVAATGTWSFVLLRRTPNWNLWPAWTVARVMTAQKLQQLVKAGRLHYVMTGGGRAAPGEGNSEVTSWVMKNCTAVKVSEYGGSSSSAQNGGSLYLCG